MGLPPYKLITTPQDWQTCLETLQAAPRLAIDLEANSMFAYQEQVCLIQISVPNHDYIIDPVAPIDLSGLGEIVANPDVGKVLHAAEYDLLLLKRQYDWQLNNLFDTMWAARILGYKRYGLANLLQKLYDVKLNKRYQKSDWCRRPLSPEQLIYAQYDTHFLLQLRDDLYAQLQQAGHLAEAAETFVQQTQVKLTNHEFDPDSFWSFTGVYELSASQQAILKALNIYRDEEAKRRNQPHFKVLGERTLVELAKRAPRSMQELEQIYGMTAGQMQRYGRSLLAIIQQNRRAAAPPPPKRHKRHPDIVLNRYEKLHTWRKQRAQKRGVESDVIISREALWAIARLGPKTMGELEPIESLGEWRRQTYGAEILNLLQDM
ncbi:MAG: HRDC domain-containing protein [Ardenticatenaceae bacterium]|nr:HRDC domain-containing protein [Ardenticatenaceae bacterium]MCB8989290.1 HRDC domain-containing protein [Ardenticatenaceae bacterium]